MRTTPPDELEPERALKDVPPDPSPACYPITKWTRPPRWWPWARRRVLIGCWCGRHGASWGEHGCTWRESIAHSTVRY